MDSLTQIVLGASVAEAVAGKKFGNKLTQLKIGKYALVKEKHLLQTQSFFERHGAKTIVIARFVPIVRTFAPFTAGIASMPYKIFVKYNIIGGITWVLGLTLLGYYFGNLPFVRQHFETVIFGIIGLSLLPMIIAIVKEKWLKK